jgi:hypothetical protein
MADVTAAIRRVVPSLESAMYATVTMSFRNDTARSLTIARYRISWPGGTATIVPSSDMVLGPGESREWSVRIHPDAGDLDALTTGSTAHVEVVEVR